MIGSYALNFKTFLKTFRKDLKNKIENSHAKEK